ncbi:peptidyl-glycine alpha-amidating monooxygenase A-like [Pecten maximus]|uniref:peptidyl-glycine alpha-amidating monooxygenase A-like n=1 Tax=Pecten maximus TaxID=6579 RepID=UPI0014582277|nr:peptidyl-glycine alpha-amidating monooxygenase A-like [Pecten maximus]
MLYLFVIVVLTLPYIGSSMPSYHQEVLQIPLSSFVGPDKVQYACISVPLKANEYIVDFQPHSPSGGVHHMALYSCVEPYERHSVWECIDPKHVCKTATEKRGVYAWNLGAPGWTLPSYTGIFTGNSSGFLVFQIHGRHDLTQNHLDKYGSIALEFRTKRPPLDTVMKVYGSDGYIPANTLGFTTDVACTWDMSISAPIVGYALHTHDYGVAVSAYLIRNGTWIEIGRVDPRYSMVTYDTSVRNLHVHPGDTVAVRCTYDNHGTTDVQMGYKHSDEMCNMFFYYAIPHSFAETSTMTPCSNNAQDFHWEDVFDNIPSLASDVSGDTDQNRYMKTHHLPRKI